MYNRRIFTCYWGELLVIHAGVCILDKPNTTNKLKEYCSIRECAGHNKPSLLTPFLIKIFGILATIFSEFLRTFFI